MKTKPEVEWSLVCARCRETLPERWNEPRCTPLPPVGGSEVWWVIMPEDGSRAQRRPVYLCVECTESLRDWFSGSSIAELKGK